MSRLPELPSALPTVQARAAGSRLRKVSTRSARREIITIVAAARDAGLYTNLITAGVLLDAGLMARLVAVGLDHVQISVRTPRRQVRSGSAA